MRVLFATFRGHVFRSEFRALRSFARRGLAGDAVANLFWHGGTSASRRSLPTNDLNAVVGRGGGMAMGRDKKSVCESRQSRAFGVTALKGRID